MPGGINTHQQDGGLDTGPPGSGDLSARMKVIHATFKHQGSKPLHHRLGLDVEVATHGIQVPMTEETNRELVDTGAKQSHGT